MYTNRILFILKQAWNHYTKEIFVASQFIEAKAMQVTYHIHKDSSRITGGMLELDDQGTEIKALMKEYNRHNVTIEFRV